jgi:hypothetical protein
VTKEEYESVTIGKFTMRDKNYDAALVVDEIPEGTPASGFLF